MDHFSLSVVRSQRSWILCSGSYQAKVKVILKKPMVFDADATGDYNVVTEHQVPRTVLQPYLH